MPSGATLDAMRVGKITLAILVFLIFRHCEAPAQQDPASLPPVTLECIAADLPRVQRLSLSRGSDADLVRLKALTQLQQLILTYADISGAGLTHLKTLTRLEELWLMETKVTDAGLEHLKPVTQL
jgi:hypothetical protein